MKYIICLISALASFSLHAESSPAYFDQPLEIWQIENASKVNPKKQSMEFLGFSQVHIEANNTEVLVFKYVTDIELSDEQTLYQQAKEIWQQLEADVGKTPFNNAMISACTNLIDPSELDARYCYNFVWQKDAEGWQDLQTELSASEIE